MIAEPGILDIVEGLKVGKAMNELVLGSMWELFLASDDTTTVMARSLTVSSVPKEWRTFSSEFMGTTNLTDKQIRCEGKFPESTSIVFV
jgi:hypothetical protein